MKIKLLLLVVIFLASILRLYKLDVVPTGLYSDEVSIAYNAKTILETGKDEWGENYPILFKAYGEYKLPVYIYLTAISERTFGFTDFAVRLPSAIAGVFAVLLAFLLLKSRGNKTALLAAFLMCISPWSLQFSRGGFESNVALTLMLLAIWFFPRHLFFSVIFLFFSSQTYLSSRVFGPVIFVALYFIYRPKVNVRFIMAVLILIIPFVPIFLSPAGMFRFQNQSILNIGGNVLQNIQENFVKNFSFDFLFFQGDSNPRHSLLVLGVLYLWQLPFILIGIFKRRSLFFLFWLFAGALPVTLSSTSPHALRGLMMVFPWQALTALGLIKFKKILIIPIVSVFLIYYLHCYYVHIPSELGQYWGGDIKEVLKTATKLPAEKIYVQELILPPYYHWYVNTPDKFVYVEGSRSLMDLNSQGSLLIVPARVDLPYKMIISKKWWKIYEL